jgi:glutamyl-tRNA synthetase
MGITHVVRGDDHLTNAFKQAKVYELLGWEAPVFAHIPLIHGPDGAKMSKRHGAVGVETYRDKGYLPEAMRNYLLRLGWGHGDVEIVSTEKAIELFDLDGVGKSAARFDFDKLDNFNGHYLRQADDTRLTDLVQARLAAELGRELTGDDRSRLLAGMDGLKQRAKTLQDLAESARFYVQRPKELTPKAAKQLTDDARARLVQLADRLQGLSNWNHDLLESETRTFAEELDLGLGKVAQPLRAALTGSTVSPGIFEVMEVLGRQETLTRLRAVAEAGARDAAEND